MGGRTDCPAGTRRNNNVFTTSTRRRRWRSEDVIFASLLRYVSVGWQTVTLISVDAAKRISRLDTWACQIVGHFFQAIRPHYPKPSPRTVGWTDERMKLQWRYSSASMSADGKPSGYTMQHGKSYAIPSKWLVSKCTETWKCGERTGGQTDGRTSGWELFLFPLNLVHDKNVIRNEYQKM